MDLKFDQKLAVSGLRIQTLKEKMLQSFTLKYSRFDHLTSSGEMRDVEVFGGVPHVSFNTNELVVIRGNIDGLTVENHFSLNKHFLIGG